MPGFQVNGVGHGAPSSVKPLYSYTWEISVVYGDVIGSVPSIDKMPLIYIKDATLPTFEVEQEKVLGASLNYKFAKAINWQDIKLTWYDTVGLADKLRTWRRAVWTAENGLSPSSQYKRTSDIKTFSFSWDDPITWRLIGSWPSHIASSDLTYTESNVKSVTVTLTYDWAEEFIGDGPTN